jgi:hypothetical protein
LPVVTSPTSFPVFDLSTFPVVVASYSPFTFPLVDLLTFPVVEPPPSFPFITEYSPVKAAVDRVINSAEAAKSPMRCGVERRSKI